MKEVRAWMDEAEKLIKFIRLQSDPEKETKIQEKIEVMVNMRCILYFIVFLEGTVTNLAI